MQDFAFKSVCSDFSPNKSPLTLSHNSLIKFLFQLHKDCLEYLHLFNETLNDEQLVANNLADPPKVAN